MQIKRPTVIASLLAITAYPTLLIADETQVKIDPSVQAFIGGNSVLDRDKFFNLHSTPTSSEFTPSDIQLITEDLNAGFGRSFWSPLSASGDTFYPSTEFAIEQGAKNIQNQQQNDLYRYTDNRLIITDHPRNVMRDGNAPVEGARWAADYFEYYYTDENRPLYYEPMNEPFVHAQDFVEGGWDLEQNAIVQDQMTEWFKQIALEFDNRGLNTKVVGYSSAWPSMELNDFEHWRSRQMRFMDLAGDEVDAFSFHLYDGVNVAGQDNIRSGSNAEAIMDLIETYSHYKWDKVKPHALTEYGGIIDGYEGVDYSPERSSQELRALNHLLFSALAREDRLLTSIPFISGKAEWFYQANNFQPYSAALFRPDPSKIVGNKVNGFLLTEKAKFFQLWSEVKGKRVAITEQDPDLASQAFVYGNKLYVALNNLETEAKTVSLNFDNNLGNLQQVQVKRLNVPYGEAASLTDEVLQTAPDSLTLADSETVVLTYQFGQALTQNSSLNIDTYYAKTHLQPINANTPIEFEINGVVLNSTPTAFTDYFANQFDYDAQVNVNQNSQLQRKHTVLLKRLNAKFNQLVARSPDNWQNDVRLQGMVKSAQRNPVIQQALQIHYQQNGFNSSDTMSTLRMSIGRKHDKSKQPVLSVNGHLVEVPNDWAGYDQASRSDFFGAIDIPVPTRYLKQNNQISLTFPDDQGRVSSLVLDVVTQSDLQQVATTGIELNHADIQDGVLNINKDKPRRLQAHVLPKNASVQQIKWTSLTPEVVSVDDNGIITPIQPGSAIVVATTAEGDFSEQVNVEVLDQISIANTVTIIEDTSDEISSDTYQIKVAYSTNKDRDIALEMRSPTNEWLGEARVTVPAGEGETEITFNLQDNLPPGTGYRWVAGLRAIDGNWRTNVDGHAISGIVIHDEDWIATDDSSVELLSQVDNLQVAPSYKMTVQYRAVVESDITLDLNHTSGWMGGTRTTVQPGTGSVDLTVWPVNPIVADDGYRFNVAIREVGGNWQTDYANLVIENITISDQDLPDEDNNLIGDLNPDFESAVMSPWTLAWDAAGSGNVTTTAAFEGDYGLSIDTSSGKVGILLDSSVLPQDLYQQGQQIKLSFYAKRASAGGWVGGFAQFWNNASGWVGSPQKWFEIKSEWSKVEFVMDGENFTPGNTNMQFNFNKAGELFYIDNFKVEIVEN